MHLICLRGRCHSLFVFIAYAQRLTLAVFVAAHPPCCHPARILTKLLRPTCWPDIHTMIGASHHNQPRPSLHFPSDFLKQIERTHRVSVSYNEQDFHLFWQIQQYLVSYILRPLQRITHKHQSHPPNKLALLLGSEIRRSHHSSSRAHTPPPKHDIFCFAF